MARRHIFLIGALALRAVLSVCAARAQAPELDAAFPPGGRRGTTVEITLTGRNLEKPTAVLVSGPGARAALVPDRAAFRLQIAPDAPLGEREVRVLTAKGGSNPVRIWIDAFPDLLEKEPNDQSEQAQALTQLPVTVSGRMDAPADRDIFSFEAGAGETWVFDLNTWRHHSAMSGLLDLRDAEGRRLKMAACPWESDNRLIYAFAKAGRYQIQVYDTQFKGGPNYTYRLTLGKIPVITDYYPHALTRAGPPVKGTVLDAQGVNYAEPPGGLLIVVPEDTPEGGFWAAPETPTGTVLPIRFYVGMGGAVREWEPNDPPPPGPKARTPLPWDITNGEHRIGGRFDKPGDVDAFPLTAKAGRTFVFDLLARRIGSEADGVLRVTDSAGKELAQNDDAIGRDPRLVWKAPADGDYRLEVSNADGRSGPDFFYVLETGPALPDFRLYIPRSKTEAGRGGATILPVQIERLHGFEGAVTVRAERLPAGVSLQPVTLAPGMNSEETTLTVEETAALAGFDMKIVGEAAVGGRKIVQEAVSREQYLPRFIDPGMFTDDSYRQPWRACAFSLLTVIEHAETFTLKAAPAVLSLAPGQKAEITVEAARNPNTDGDIALELRGLPPGVQADVKPIAKGQSRATITLSAAPNAAPAVRNLIVIGRLDKQTQTAPALTLTVGGK